MRHAGVMASLPTPLRAALGLVATALDEARTLPDKAIELPMLAVSTALQLSLRAQQRYAHLAARGDELLNHRAVTDEAAALGHLRRARTNPRRRPAAPAPGHAGPCPGQGEGQGGGQAEAGRAEVGRAAQVRSRPAHRQAVRVRRDR